MSLFRTNQHLMTNIHRVIQPQLNGNKIINIKVIVFIAKHSSIASVDYLTTLLGNCSIKESAFAK
ncbi:hypothetical protein CVS40_8197 [Lucilia cuprina]|nr:hypothetical protein CVS40_8197 [Lucilia cuprina]